MLFPISVLVTCCNGVDTAFNNTEQLGPQRAGRALKKTGNEQKSMSDGKEGYEKTKPAETVGLPVSPWRRAWQPTPVLLPGKSRGQRSLIGYSPWGRKESDMTEVT